VAEPDFYCMHAELCKTLANEKRQRILDTLRLGELTVGEIVARTGIPQANASQHLGVLRGTGVVNARREGAHVFYSIANVKIITAFDLITEVMQESFESRNQTAGGASRTEPSSEGGSSDG
jgi:DNA-binding transcriptional ArsR family regulator